jgi:hypothetical protein
MKPITPIVPGFNLPVTKFAENQQEYITLPAWVGPDGMVVTRWSLSWAERLRILFGGSLWLSVLTFNKPLQPVKLTAECPIMGHTGHDEEID